ncbi:MAG TPA: AAA family ATPase [Planctomycetota bacterium]|jgi:hypothetical protein
MVNDSPTARSPKQKRAPLPLEPAALGLNARAGPVTLLQTHIGWVYLCGKYAFKIKKPVKFDFLDFTTVSARRWACAREIVLNRRLCPKHYLGLVPIVEQPAGTLRLDLKRNIPQPTPVAPASVPAGRDADATPNIVDWAVWMRRMPADRMLPVLLERGNITAVDIRRIANTLTRFYLKQRAQGAVPPGGPGDLDSLTFNVEENLREAEALDPGIVAPGALRLISVRARHFLKKNGWLVCKRATDGFVVDGHGDLRAENICLPQKGPPLLFDCIEFNDRFRIVDCALDAAFLAMDLSAKGRDDLSAAFLHRYQQRCDPDLPPRLLDFYFGYRAFVKAKVAAWIAADTGVPSQQQQRARSESRDLFDLSVRCALREQPVLIVFCGPAGSGKSTLARALARRLRCIHLATDILRDELVPRGLSREERYAPGVSWRVYELLFQRAADALQRRQTVILDATFTSKSLRTRAAQLASAGSAGLRAGNARSVLVWAKAPAETMELHLKERLESQTFHGSEASAEVSRRQFKTFAKPSEKETRKAGGGGTHTSRGSLRDLCVRFGALRIVDTSQPAETSVEQTWNAVLDALAEQ